PPASDHRSLHDARPISSGCGCGRTCGHGGSGRGVRTHPEAQQKENTTLFRPVRDVRHTTSRAEGGNRNDANTIGSPVRESSSGDDDEGKRVTVRRGPDRHPCETPLPLSAQQSRSCLGPSTRTPPIADLRWRSSTSTTRDRYLAMTEIYVSPCSKFLFRYQESLAAERMSVESSRQNSLSPSARPTTGRFASLAVGAPTALTWSGS